MPEHVNVHAILTIGFADELPEMPPKYRIEHFMFFERWWGRIEPPKTGLGIWSSPIKKGTQETHKKAKKESKKLMHKIKEKLKKKK